MRRWFWRFLVTLLVLLVLAAALTWWRLWRALPVTDGHTVVQGLSGPVEIQRDAYGVPHVRASTEADAYTGLGYVHAQDRLWQMEFQRRVARGRLSEVFGPEALDTDRLFRTLGFGRVASRMWERTGGDARALIDAYVRGVNAVIAQQRGTRLPVEFWILGVQPEPWTPEDCFVWARVISLELDTNYRDELLRARVAARVGVEGAAALMPPYTAGGPLILPEGIAPTAPSPPGTLPPGTAAVLGPPATSSRRPGPRGDPAEWLRLASRLASTAVDGTSPASAIAGFGGGGSNNWVVSGARSTTGRPLLANDPHLGAALPSTWYLAHLEGGPLNTIGATMPGTPGMPVGHNGRIAWGVTSLMPDVQDLYIERIDARQQAEYRGGWEPMTVVHETIRVKGAPEVQLAVRATRHGPLISDVLPGTREALALRWTALDADDNLLEAFRALSLARNWEEFTVALAAIRTPALNFVYADVDGNIGYFAPGAIPIRPRHDGTLPVPGWTDEFEWTGFVAAERLPRIYNPTRGFVVTANNRALADDYPYVLSTNWEPGYRAERITQLIDASPPLSMDAIARMQADVRTPQVRRLLPWLRRARAADDESRAALTRLSRWDGALEAGSADAALFMAWVDALTPALFADELGEVYDDWAQWPHWRAKALDLLVARGEDHWCDDTRTGILEVCEDVLARTLRAAIDHLATVQGSRDPTRWRWEEENRVTFRHVPFDAVALLRPLFSREAALGGNATTVNPVARRPQRTVIASYRQIVDLSDFDRSRFVHPPGQSGQLGSSHYADLLEPWRRVEYIPMVFSRGAVDAATVGRLRLEPR